MFSKSMTMGTMATTRLSTAPVNQVVQPRCKSDRKIKTSSSPFFLTSIMLFPRRSSNGGLKAVDAVAFKRKAGWPA